MFKLILTLLPCSNVMDVSDIFQDFVLFAFKRNKLVWRTWKTRYSQWELVRSNLHQKAMNTLLLVVPRTISVTSPPASNVVNDLRATLYFSYIINFLVWTLFFPHIFQSSFHFFFLWMVGGNKAGLKSFWFG